jgi:hypothetical protein
MLEELYHYANWYCSNIKQAQLTELNCRVHWKLLKMADFIQLRTYRLDAMLMFNISCIYNIYVMCMRKAFKSIY